MATKNVLLQQVKELNLPPKPKSKRKTTRYKYEIKKQKLHKKEEFYTPLLNLQLILQFILQLCQNQQYSLKLEHALSKD